MRRIFYLLIISSVIVSCNVNKVIVSATTTDKIYKITVDRNIDEFQIFILFQKVKEVTGIIELQNLRRLYISGLDGIKDYSFLSQLPNLEILIMESTFINDFTFLKKLTKLRILYLDGVTIKKNQIDLVNNTQLSYMALFNIHLDKVQYSSDFDLLNIPTNLLFLDLSNNSEIKFTTHLFDSLKKIQKVIILSDDYEEYENILMNYNNLIIQNNYADRNNILPTKFQKEILLKEPKYRIYEFDKKIQYEK